MTTYPIHTQLRVITPKNLSFGVGEVIASTPSVVTLQNRNEETVTVPTDVTRPLPGMMADQIANAVTGIQTQIGMMNALGQLPYVRTFADLHDHMDANVLLLNHVPEIFPRHDDGELNDRQTEVENFVSDTVNAWLMERWDNDPINMPAPDTDEQIASILHAMLGMSLDEQQWCDAKVVEVHDGFGPDQVRLRVADHTFTIRVTRED